MDLGPDHFDAPPGSAVPAEDPPPPAPPPPSKSGLAFFGVVLALFVGPGSIAQVGNPLLGFTWSGLFGLLLPSVLAASASNLDARRALSLARRPAPRLLGLAVLVGVAGSFAAGALMALGSLVLPRRWLELFDAVTHLFDRPRGEKIALALLAATLAPFWEEVAFRGWLLTALRTRLRTGAALAFSGLLFALMHLDPVRFPALVALGIAFAWLTWRSGSLWPAVVAHGTNNALGLALTATGSATTSLSQLRQDPWQVLSFALPLLAFGVSALALVLAAFRRATPQPPPLEDLLVRRDPGASTAFRLERAGRRFAVAAVAAVLTWLPLAALAARHVPRRR
ncbi:MAG TPA: type II CAAX endopeptidase family protein [Anaeromyxobacteraceae bacterium]|nr:type II CAAX endopeptidase family protein [Anaeromyxobacteraceae bacterium]